ncbi:hypothetical protein D3C73_975500 [compost metagenome]
MYKTANFREVLLPILILSILKLRSLMCRLIMARLLSRSSIKPSLGPLTRVSVLGSSTLRNGNLPVETTKNSSFPSIRRQVFPDNTSITHASTSAASFVLIVKAVCCINSSFSLSGLNWECLSRIPVKMSGLTICSFSISASAIPER